MPLTGRVFTLDLAQTLAHCMFVTFANRHYCPAMLMLLLLGYVPAWSAADASQ